MAAVPVNVYFSGNKSNISSGSSSGIDLSSYVTKAELDSYAKISDINSHIDTASLTEEVITELRHMGEEASFDFVEDYNNSFNDNGE